MSLTKQKLEKILIETYYEYDAKTKKMAPGYLLDTQKHNTAVIKDFVWSNSEEILEKILKEIQ